MNASSDGDPSAWVGQARFAIEGVTQGLVGLFGLVGEFKLYLLQWCSQEFVLCLSDLKNSLLSVVSKYTNFIKPKLGLKRCLNHNILAA